MRRSVSDTDRYIGGMQIEITDEARTLLERKGGTMSIDFIRPTG